MKKCGLLMAVIFMLGAVLAGCGQQAQKPPVNDPEPIELVLATTTSTYDSGLLDYLLPLFEAKHNYKVKVVSLGTGQALETGKNGDADVLLVHAKATELEMVEQGHFVDRHDVMYNDYIVVGPASDPAGIKGQKDIQTAMTVLNENKAPFISRGDDSGTHKKELTLWKAAALTPEGDWYISAGAGMGDTLRMADEKLGYTLTDRATYLAQKANLDLEILFEGDKGLFNQYGVMAVNPANFPDIKYEGAKAFISYLISEEGQAAIAGFKPFGDTLFFPNAK